MQLVVATERLVLQILYSTQDRQPSLDSDEKRHPTEGEVINIVASMIHGRPTKALDIVHLAQMILLMLHTNSPAPVMQSCVVLLQRSSPAPWRISLFPVLVLPLQLIHISLRQVPTYFFRDKVLGFASNALQFSKKPFLWRRGRCLISTHCSTLGANSRGSDCCRRGDRRSLMSDHGIEPHQ